MPNKPIGNAMLLVDCDPVAPRGKTLGDAAQAYQITAAKLDALQAVAARHQVPAECGKVQQTTLVVDSNTVPQVQNVLAQPVQRVDRRGFPLTDRRGNPELTIDVAALKLAVNAAQQQFSGYAAATGLTEDIQAITLQPLPVQMTRPTIRR